MPGGMPGMGGYGSAAPSAMATGSMIGGALPMVGTIAGAGIGAAANLFGQDKEAKAREKELKRQRQERKQARILDTLQQGQAQRLAGMANLSQAAFDWAQALR